VQYRIREQEQRTGEQYMKAVGVKSRQRVSTFGLVLIAGVVAASPAVAQPLIRQAAGANPAAIQAAVDQFRADLGGINNANTAGSQNGGRREINWDGGGNAANAVPIAQPMTTFANRGAVFTTPGRAFEQSGQPLPEFGDLNPTYPDQFQFFSTPRLFTALNSNVLDSHFFVPGNTSISAAVPGFGVVFTDVETATSTKMEFYAPDGSFLGEWFAPASTSGSLSFLGVSFPNGELVGRVRIVSGNAALGPDETAGLDIVAMDDFIYGEPVATAGLIITPTTGQTFRASPLNIVLGIKTPAGTALVNGRVKLNGGDVTGPFLGCITSGTLVGGGITLRCDLPPGIFPAGDHVLQVELDLSNATRLRNAVRWTVIANTEP
jgi:hypothetical protein